MEFKIVNPDTTDYCEGVGISPERQQELSRRLDEMVHREDNQPLHFVKMANIYAEIASFCNNEPELVYCTVLHCGWHQRRGRTLAPGPVNDDIIKLWVEMLFEQVRKYRYGSYFARVEMILLKITEVSIDERKEGVREGVKFLLEIGEETKAKAIINYLTGWAF